MKVSILLIIFIKLLLNWQLRRWTSHCSGPIDTIISSKLSYHTNTRLKTAVIIILYIHNLWLELMNNLYPYIPIRISAWTMKCYTVIIYIVGKYSVINLAMSKWKTKNVRNRVEMFLFNRDIDKDIPTYYYYYVFFLFCKRRPHSRLI